MMRKVLIIDDDVPMLRLLQQMIDWESLNLQLVGATYSSAKAVSLFEKSSPDIVISDIGLPKKNGIELAEQFIQMKPSVRIIFLTCHEDFHYAQRALKLDADDYLIKDQLTKEQLEQSLLKSIRLLQSTDIASSKKMSNYNNDLYKHGLFQRLMDGIQPKETLSYASQLGISWEYPYFMIGVANIMFSTYEQHYRHRDLSSILYGIYNIAVELSAVYEGITVFNEQNNIVFIYNLRSNLANNPELHLRKYMDSVHEQCQHYLKVQIRLIAFTDKLELQAIGSVYQEMMKEHNLFYEQEAVIMISRNAYSRVVFLTTPQQFMEPYKAELERALVKGDEGLVADILVRMGRDAKEYKLDPTELGRYMISLLRGLEITFASLTEDKENFAYLLSAKSIEDLLQMVQSRLLKIMQKRGDRAGTAIQEPKLQVIQAFIDQHLSENITSIDMAHYLFLNPSYFSRYFKRLTGVNFTDYVHQYKMNIASKVLKTTDQTLESVAMMLGYSDRSYFSKVFKKYIGVTPSDYKLRYGLNK